MKLIKHTPTKLDCNEDQFTTSVELISDDLDEIKSKVIELCRLIGIKPSAWTSKYPIMGNSPINTNTEWVMILHNGTVFSIEN